MSTSIVFVVQRIPAQEDVRRLFGLVAATGARYFDVVDLLVVLDLVVLAFDTGEYVDVLV